MDEIRGLSAAAVAERTAAGAANRIERRGTRSLPVILLSNIFIVFNLLLAPLLVILFALGQYKDVLSVGSIAFLNTLINIIQEIRAKRALERIRMEHPALAWVVRDGRRLQVPSETVVRDDCLVLVPGELAIGDGPVLSSRHLECDESMLTGESEYVAKPAGSVVLSGSFAVAGEGIYRAEKIGAECYMQQVVEQSRRPKAHRSPLERRIGRLVNAFMLLCLLVAGVLLLVYRPSGENLVEPVRYIVASVTSLIPQGLVLIVTVAFAFGVINFARRGIIFRRINAVEGLANVDLICMDKTGTLTENRITLERLVPQGGFAETVLAADLAAFAATSAERNKTIEAIAAALPASGEPRLLDEVPFKSREKLSAARLARGTDRCDLVLGAYEMLEARFDPHDGGAVREAIAAAESEGLRTLAVGRRPAATTPLADDLSGFTLVGLVCLSERIKDEAPEILRGFAEKGVRQVVISGDSLTTVQAIARRIGLPAVEHGATGSELAALAEDAFRTRVLGTTVFARVAPEMKRAIIRVFREAGHDVAMVGDGVNDVLALKEADLSIAMGSGGSMAKDVSDIVLVNNRFDLLPGLLVEGERIVSRIGACARIFTLKNFSALFLIGATLALGLVFPFFPQQITIVNFITITIPLLYLVRYSNHTARVGSGFLGGILRFSLVYGLISAAAALVLNALFCAAGAGKHHAQSAALVPLVVLSLSAFLYLLNRARTPRGLGGDRRMLILLVPLLAVFLGAYYHAPAAAFFELVPLSGADWATVALVTVPALLLQWLLMRLLPAKAG